MIDIDTIEEVEDCDGESIFAYGLDPETGKFAWAWISVATLYESGRTDLLQYAGVYREDNDGE